MSLATALRRSTLSAGIAAAALAGAIATSGPASAAAGCNTDCISSFSVNQYLQTGAAAYVKVQTGPQTNVRLDILKPGGGSLTAVADLAGSFTNAHNLNTGYVMEQGVTYTVKVSATDRQGRTHVETKSIRALKRTVTLNVGTVTVNEDSDYGAGEIGADIKLGAGTGRLFNERSISATKTFSLYYTADFPMVPASTKLMVEMEDNDNDGGVFTYCVPRAPFTTGSNDCWDWSTGSTSISFAQTKGVTEGSFAVGTNSGPVRFTVMGTYEAIVA